MNASSEYKSPLGSIGMTSNGEAITGLWFDGQRNVPPNSYPTLALPVFDMAKRWLDLYFGGDIPDFTPPLAPSGSPFRRTVWDILARIPYGETLTYGGIADTVAKLRGIEKMSAQAVGGAVAHNPVSLMIPCHRVIGADGSLTGYAGGTDKKLYLLELERGVMRNRSV